MVSILKIYLELLLRSGKAIDLKLHWKYQVDLFKLQPWGKKWPHPRGHLSCTQVSDTGLSLPSCFTIFCKES